MSKFQSPVTITNTSSPAEMNRSALEVLITGGDGFIERMEARGQRELVAQAQGSALIKLPSQFSGREYLKAAGVIFGEPDKSDPLFATCTVPDGWKIVPTDHSMGSNLVDDKGRIRASIFYKAAFYDRRADGHACRRYTSRCYFDGEMRIPQILDGGAVIWSGEAVTVDRAAYDAAVKRYHAREIEWEEVEKFDATSKAGVIAREELLRRFPDADSFTAYWD